MIYTEKIQKAIKFSVKTHEVYQKQKRKGKDIAYIVHPLTVGIILSQAGASEDAIVAGILHDTIEDSIKDKKVDNEMIKERFGANVAKMVDDVTEQNKELPWKERKKTALEHIKTMDEKSLWVKTADVICNLSELLDDHHRYGNEVLDRFNANREDTIANHRAVLAALIGRWESSDNPMLADLKKLSREISELEI